MAPQAGCCHNHAIKLSSADQPAASMQLAEEAKEVLEDDVAQAET